MTVTWTAECPACHDDVEWQATSVEQIYGQVTIFYRIACSSCDRKKAA